MQLYCSAFACCAFAHDLSNGGVLTPLVPKFSFRIFPVWRCWLKVVSDQGPRRGMINTCHVRDVYVYHSVPTLSVPGLKELSISLSRLIRALIFIRRDERVMKPKTHSGAKKRMRLLPGGKVKRKQCGIRHLLSPHKSKTMRHLGDTAYVHTANMYQVRRLLAF